MKFLSSRNFDVSEKLALRRSEIFFRHSQKILASHFHYSGNCSSMTINEKIFNSHSKLVFPVFQRSHYEILRAALLERRSLRVLLVEIEVDSRLSLRGIFE